MIFTRRLSIALCALAFIASSSSANALLVNYTGTHTPGDTFNFINMGNTQVGQYGSLNNFYFTNPNSASIGRQTGFIPAMSKISFTFSGFSTATNGYGFLEGNYNAFSSGNLYTGYANANTNGATFTNATVNGAPSPFLLFATANINAGTITGTFVNNSPVRALFNFYELALLRGGSASATYAVSLSAVPLPAALPMFASLLMGAFGLSRFKKRKSLAA